MAGIDEAGAPRLRAAAAFKLRSGTDGQGADMGVAACKARAIDCIHTVPAPPTHARGNKHTRSSTHPVRRAELASPNCRSSLVRAARQRLRVPRSGQVSARRRRLERRRRRWREQRRLRARGPRVCRQRRRDWDGRRRMRASGRVSAACVKDREGGVRGLRSKTSKGMCATRTRVLAEACKVAHVARAGDAAGDAAHDDKREQRALERARGRRWGRHLCWLWLGCGRFRARARGGGLAAMC